MLIKTKQDKEKVTGGSIFLHVYVKEAMKNVE